MIGEITSVLTDHFDMDLAFFIVVELIDKNV